MQHIAMIVIVIDSEDDVKKVLYDVECGYFVIRKGNGESETFEPKSVTLSTVESPSKTFVSGYTL